ncbi:Nitrogen regulation protein NR(II) [Fundidesulfovibrio magnetotacticus]|uniref:histidine kinase n=1 Tax=Fundidesulfovibrio magnetotacticus TaxID=2730080 RepID=A0A6V8LSR5_9BACT|nr:PAS domain-containing protein [Fundidesulfovibrio magnetotacticus]GFK92836.1 Nitrogen regulation protein NR(II) [Fundidesulfovibrio magnetotacticus]
MSIRRKLFLGVAAASLVTVVCGFAAVRFLGLESFRRVDQERAVNDIARVAAALDNELAHMDTALRFKSASDITYRFAKDRDRQLAANYFSLEALRGGNLNLMALYDPLGAFVAGAAFDLATRESLPLTPLLESLPPAVRLSGTGGSPIQGRGLADTEAGLMLLCWQPVFNSLGWGPPRGTLAAGRILDERMAETLSRQLHVRFTIQALDRADPSAVAGALTARREDRPASFGPENEESLTAYAVYPGYDGAPVALLSVHHPKADIAQLRQAMLAALGLVGLAGLCTFGVSLWLLVRTVTRPLERITRHVRGLKDAQGLSRPLALGRSDELGALADALDAAGRDLARLYGQLDRQNAALSLLVENIPHPISVKDGQGRYVLANPALAELLGQPLTRLTGATDRELNAPAGWARRARQLEAEVLLGGEPRFASEEIFDAPAGGTRLFETSRLPLADPESGATRVLTVSLDVTERARAEERLRLSENRYRSLFDSMNEGAVVHEIVHGADGEPSDYRVLDVNAAFERILGISRARAVGALASQLYGTPEAPFLAVYSRVAETGEPALFEVFFEPMDKHFTISSFRPAPGQFASIFTDTTERLKTQKALQNAHLTIQHVLDSMPSPVIGVDALARVTHANRAASALLEHAQGGLHGRPLAQAFPALAPHMAAVADSLERGGPAELHRIPLTVGGVQRLCDLQAFPMTAAGRVTGAVVRIDDVTERVRMQEVVLQTEKMMSVGGLAAGMAHEINNPLGGILQSVQIIKRRLQEDLPANIREAKRLGCPLENVLAYLEAREVTRFLDGIHEAGRRAAAIVANMLEFSRRSESKMTPSKLDAVVDKALELASSDYDLRKKYDFRLIGIVRDYDPALPSVRCTKTEIEQVLLNLIKNAAQALSMGPSPDAPRITLRLIREESFARIEVEDNGPGMEEAVRKRVFEPFFTTKPTGVGTGLGLSVSYFIVTQNHGGSMTVESSPGRGARFIVRLPFSPPPQA